MSEKLIFSRSETRLLAEANSAVDMQSRRVKRAELAAYQSRIGRFDLARLEINNLRGDNSKLPSIKVSISIHIAEGLFNYFSGTGIVGDDSMERAYALSVAGGERQLQATSASWLAQWEYSKFNFKAMWRYVAESLRLAEAENSAAISRACLVCAQALHLAGRTDLSRIWYRKSHETASRVQDDATVGAILHNTSWLQMLHMRQTILTGLGQIQDGRQALLNAKSTENFDLLHGKSSWNELKPLLQAQILSLDDKFEEALAIYLNNIDAIQTAGRLRASLSADVAWCLSRQARNGEALGWAGTSEEGLSEVSQLDDRAAAHSMLSRTYSNLSMFEKSQAHTKYATDLWSEHIEIQNSILLLFKEYQLQ
jgi:tetratricopeptide (TPR) repeat protein